MLQSSGRLFDSATYSVFSASHEVGQFPLVELEAAQAAKCALNNSCVYGVRVGANIQ